MTVLGTQEVFSPVQGASMLEVAAEAESITSGIGDVLSTQTSIKRPIEQLSIITRVWNAGCGEVLEAYKQVKGSIIRVWDRSLLPFRLRSAMEELRTLTGKQALHGELLVHQLFLIKDTELTTVKRLYALDAVLALSGTLLLDCTEEQRGAVDIIIFAAFEALPPPLRMAIYSRLPGRDRRVNFGDIRRAVAKVYRALPSIALAAFESRLDQATTNWQKCAIFLAMRHIRVNGLEPDLTLEMLNAKLACILSLLNESARELLLLSSSEVYHT